MMFKRGIVALLLCAGVAAADGPDAIQLVKDASAYAKALAAVSFHLELSTHLEAGPEKRDLSLSADVTLNGPRQSKFEIKTVSDAASVLSNGEDLFVYDPQDKTYRKMKAPLDREKALGMISGDPMRKTTLWLGQFMNASLDLVQGATGEVLGEENGQKHLKLTYPNYTMELWLSPPPSALPQKIVMDVSNAFGANPNNATAVNTAVLSNWQTAPAITPELFAWKAPEGAKEQKDEREAPGANLIGKPAPDFSLDMLAGGNMKLSSHKDKEVVLLDFFATWCGPCRMSLPVVSEVAKEYKPKGVAFYAVNCGEDAEKVKKFLASQNLELPVAMDKESNVQTTYGATSIPRMILIGKDGTVQAVHAGYSPELGKDLRGQLDTLLAGKKIEE